MAQHYHRRGNTQLFSESGFDAFCKWYMYFTFPPGRVAGFGDPSPELPPIVFHYSALASAQRDPVFQWFYSQYADKTQPTHRKRAIELLYYDPTVEAVAPDGDMPLGRAYHEQGKLVSSRSSWDPVSATSVVSAKAAREFNHSHADWGQICLDGYGERLLIDLGSPPAYPATERERYYNYQQWGHNVFVFGTNDTGGVSVAVRDRAGEISASHFDDDLGSVWTMDLTRVYDGARSVKRTVAHLFPRILVVVDSAELDTLNEISMRWHTCASPNLADGGRWSVEGASARLSCLIERLDGDVTLGVGRQHYEAPYNRDALGDVFDQRREPYVEASVSGDRCRLLSLFCVQDPESDPDLWIKAVDGWQMQTKAGLVELQLDAAGLNLGCGSNRRLITNLE